jgi:hypothetical protein
MKRFILIGLCAGIFFAGVSCDDDDGSTVNLTDGGINPDAAVDMGQTPTQSRLDTPRLPRPPQGRLPSELLPPGMSLP